MIRMLMCDQNSIKFWNGKIKFRKEFSIRFALTPQSTNTFVFFVPTYMQFPSLLLAKLDSFTDYTSFLLFWADPIGKHYIIRLFKIQELHCILKCTKYQPRIFMICAFVSSRSPELSMILLAIDLNSSSFFCCFSIICLQSFSSEYPLEAF